MQGFGERWVDVQHGVHHMTYVWRQWLLLVPGMQRQWWGAGQPRASAQSSAVGGRAPCRSWHCCGPTRAVVVTHACGNVRPDLMHRYKTHPGQQYLGLEQALGVEEVGVGCPIPLCVRRGRIKVCKMDCGVTVYACAHVQKYPGGQAQHKFPQNPWLCPLLEVMTNGRNACLDHRIRATNHTTDKSHNDYKCVGYRWYCNSTSVHNDHAVYIKQMLPVVSNKQPRCTTYSQNDNVVTMLQVL